MMRRTAIWVFVCVVALAFTACGSDTSDDSPAEADGTSGRLTIDSAGPHPINAPPDKYFDLSHRLAGLVDAEDAEFSGSWYDPDTDQMVVGAATDKGVEILTKRGFVDSAELRVERVRWSLRAGQDEVRQWEEGSILAERVVMYGTLPQGDGFLVGITGDDLTDEERADLLELPGRIELETGQMPAQLG
ncbi:hypothetical protein F0U44_16405 [Nocardioides humilatus]|uniref:DUF4245 domain-containing protein n=1 Tax=Nocardioides humilatus TaxID=2607660 RepID=A0A5B1LAT1_9ACTN|nr:hypothetical protein [Nocardioides humilatus]KAA1416777.1 hypothetical protein F0U44_16405 [Nocardioides humilatus]